MKTHLSLRVTGQPWISFSGST